MQDERKAFGHRGEDLAAMFLQSKGFRIVARNWSTRVGEIDVICEKDGVTHFVEVKTRQSLTFGRPEEAITAIKLNHLRKAVESYLLAMRTPPKEYQIDALAILALPGKKPEFTLIEAIF